MIVKNEILKNYKNNNTIFILMIYEQEKTSGSSVVDANAPGVAVSLRPEGVDHAERNPEAIRFRDSVVQDVKVGTTPFLLRGRRAKTAPRFVFGIMSVFSQYYAFFLQFF